MQELLRKDETYYFSNHIKQLRFIINTEEFSIRVSSIMITSYDHVLYIRYDHKVLKHTFDEHKDILLDIFCDKIILTVNKQKYVLDTMIEDVSVRVSEDMVLEFDKEGEHHESK